MIAPWFVALLAAIGLLRLLELAVSVRRIAARPQDLVPERGLFLAMALLHAGFVFGPALEVVVFARTVGAWTPWAALLLVGATVLRVWTLTSIGGAWNVRVVRPPEAQVCTTGPYAYLRHPNYLVVILEILAVPALHGAWISSLLLSLLNALVLAVRIRNEEAVLFQSPAYRAAFADKARFLPGIF